MDEIDVRILEILRQDSRSKYVKIGEMVSLTEGAVRRRVKKMLEQRTIRRFTIETKAGVEGIVLVKTDPAQTREVAQRMRGISNKVFEVSGDYDVAAFIQAYTIEELNKKVDKIRDLPAVTDTNTLISLAQE